MSQTPLIVATNRDYIEWINQLLASGADVNEINRYGNTPLHEAALDGNAALVRQLISAGANVNAIHGDKCTPLCHAVENGRDHCVVELINAGADVNIHRNDNTLVGLAVWNDYHAILQYLIRANAPLDDPRLSDTPSPVSVAFDINLPSCFRELILAGATPRDEELYRMRKLTVSMGAWHSECAKMFFLSYMRRGTLPKCTMELNGMTLAKYMSLRRLSLDMLHDSTLYIARIARDIAGVVLSYIFALDPYFCLYCLVYRPASAADSVQVCVADYVSSSSSSKKRIAVESSNDCVKRKA